MRGVTLGVNVSGRLRFSRSRTNAGTVFTERGETQRHCGGYHTVSYGVRTNDCFRRGWEACRLVGILILWVVTVVTIQVTPGGVLDIV